MSPANAERIVNALREFGFSSPDLSLELFLKEWQIIRMGVPPVRIEIATTISGVNFGECCAKRVIAELDGVKSSVISLEDLKINKKASARHQDIADLEHLP